MVDPGVAQAIVKQLNRWYRRRAQSRGTVDHFYRGTRMTYNRTKRTAVCFMSLFLLSIAAAIYLIRGIFAGQSLWMVLILNIGGLLMMAVGILAPLQVFREFVIVTDDGLVKSGLFGRKTQWAWNDIATFQIKPDDSKKIAPPCVRVAGRTPPFAPTMPAIMPSHQVKTSRG